MHIFFVVLAIQLIPGELLKKHVSSNIALTCPLFTVEECISGALNINISCIVLNGKCVDDPCGKLWNRECLLNESCVYDSKNRVCKTHTCFHLPQFACGSDGNSNCQYSECPLDIFQNAETGKCCSPIENKLNCLQANSHDCVGDDRLCQWTGTYCMNNPCGNSSSQNECDSRDGCLYDSSRGYCLVSTCFYKTTQAACSLYFACEFAESCPCFKEDGDENGPCCMPINCSNLSPDDCAAHPNCSVVADRCITNSCGLLSPKDCFESSICSLTFSDNGDARCTYSACYGKTSQGECQNTFECYWSYTVTEEGVEGGFCRNRQECTGYLSEDECRRYALFCGMAYNASNGGLVCQDHRCRTTYHDKCRNDLWCVYDEAMKVCTMSPCMQYPVTNCPSHCVVTAGGRYGEVACMEPPSALYGYCELKDNTSPTECIATESCSVDNYISNDDFSCAYSRCSDDFELVLKCPGVFCDLKHSQPQAELQVQECVDSTCYRVFNENDCLNLGNKCTWGLCQWKFFSEPFHDSNGSCCNPKELADCASITNAATCRASERCIYINGFCELDPCQELTPQTCMFMGIFFNECVLDVDNRCVHHPCFEHTDAESCSANTEDNCNWGVCPYTFFAEYGDIPTGLEEVKSCCPPSYFFIEPEETCLNENTVEGCISHPWCYYPYQGNGCSLCENCMELHNCWEIEGLVFNGQTCVLNPCYSIQNPNATTCSAGVQNIRCEYGLCGLYPEMGIQCCNPIHAGRKCASCGQADCVPVDVGPESTYYQTCYEDGCPPGFDLGFVGNEQHCVVIHIQSCGNYKTSEECGLNQSCKWVSGTCRIQNSILCEFHTSQEECEEDAARDTLGCGWVIVRLGTGTAADTLGCRSIAKAASCSVFRNKTQCVMSGKASVWCRWEGAGAGADTETQGTCESAACTDRAYYTQTRAGESPCGAGCVSENRVCVESCGLNFKPSLAYPFLCVADDAHIIGTPGCGRACLEAAISGEKNIIIFVDHLVLDYNPTIESEGIFSLEGAGTGETTIDLNTNFLTFLGQQNSNILLGSLTLQRNEQTDSPMLSVSGSGSSSSGGGSSSAALFTLHAVSLNYNYELSSGASSPVVVKSVLFLFKSVTIKQGGIVIQRTYHLNNRMTNQEESSSCVRHTNHPALIFDGASGTFSDVVFEAINTGALSAKNGAITFEDITFKGNRIADGAGAAARYAQVRDNGFFENMALTLGKISSDVVTQGKVHNLFFTAPPTDNTTFQSVPDNVSPLFSPWAESFTLKTTKGVFTGDFVPCSFGVRVYRDGQEVKWEGGDGLLPLTVASPTAASVTLPEEGALDEKGLYSFQFVYRIGAAYIGYTEAFALHTGKGKGGDNDSNSKVLLIAIVASVASVVVIAAVGVTVLCIVLYKKKAGPFKKEKVGAS